MKRFLTSCILSLAVIFFVGNAIADDGNSRVRLKDKMDIFQTCMEQENSDTMTCLADAKLIDQEKIDKRKQDIEDKIDARREAATAAYEMKRCLSKIPSIVTVPMNDDTESDVRDAVDECFNDSQGSDQDSE